MQDWMTDYVHVSGRPRAVLQLRIHLERAATRNILAVQMGYRGMSAVHLAVSAANSAWFMNHQAGSRLAGFRPQA